MSLDGCPAGAGGEEKQQTPTSILGFSSARCCMILDARNSPRRWMMYTLLPYLVRNSASSIALSPPPITASGARLRCMHAPAPQLGCHGLGFRGPPLQLQLLLLLLLVLLLLLLLLPACLGLELSMLDCWRPSEGCRKKLALGRMRMHRDTAPEHGRGAVANCACADALVPEAVQLPGAWEVQPLGHRACRDNKSCMMCRSTGHVCCVWAMRSQTAYCMPLQKSTGTWRAR